MQKELFFSIEKTSYTENRHISLSSICTVFGAPAELLDQVSFDLSGPAMTVTALDVISRIQPLYPDYAISCVGPTECTVILKHKNGNKLFKYLKTVLLCIVMFFGGAIAIMTFHEDVDMPKVHSDIYLFFTGENVDSAPVVSIPYTVGIAVGFVTLFGLYRHKKDKPTVLDINLHDHENALRDYLAANSKRPYG